MAFQWKIILHFLPFSLCIYSLTNLSQIGQHNRPFTTRRKRKLELKTSQPIGKRKKKQHFITNFRWRSLEGSFEFTDSSLKTNINTLLETSGIYWICIFIAPEYFSKYYSQSQNYFPQHSSHFPLNQWRGEWERWKARQGKANIGSKHAGFERYTFRRPRSGEQRLMLITPGFCYRFSITSENTWVSHGFLSEIYMWATHYWNKI